MISGRFASAKARACSIKGTVDLIFVSSGWPRGAKASRFINTLSCDCSAEMFRKMSCSDSSSLLASTSPASGSAALPFRLRSESGSLQRSDATKRDSFDSLQLRIRVGQSEIGSARFRQHIQLLAPRLLKRCDGIRRGDACTDKIFPGDRDELLDRNHLIGERVGATSTKRAARELPLTLRSSHAASCVTRALAAPIFSAPAESLDYSPAPRSLPRATKCECVALRVRRRRVLSANN